MSAVPGAETAVASPFEPALSLTVAIPGANEVHVANDVRSCTVLSMRVPVATNCWDVPGAMQGGLAGVTAIVLTGDTASAVVPVMPSATALMTVEPEVMVAAVASPCEPGVLLIVAIPATDEPQVTDVVTFRLLLSANVPVAVNCAVVPGAMLESTGDTERDTRGTGAGGPTSLTLQPATASTRAHAATIHGQGLLCIVFIPSKECDGENKTDRAPPRMLL